MAKKGLQEKMQILMPSVYEESEWKDVASAQRMKSSVINNMPPGEDIMNQNHVENFIDGGLAGETSVTNHVSSSLKTGYTRGDMRGFDDLYSGESIDLWYGEVGSGDKVGFIERSNYLDRI